MTRSTDPEKARRLNAAHALLAGGEELAQAAEILIARYGVSRRQAYRYLEEARGMEQEVEVEEASIPVTIKIPGSVARLLREEAPARGLTIGDLVSRAVRDWLSRERGRG